MLTLLLGGARSGKSALAVEMGRRHAGSVTFVATAPVLDHDLAGRIDRHRAERPAWPTVEEPYDLAGALDGIAVDDLVVVDCLTLWVSNLMARGDEDAAILADGEATAEAAARRVGPTVVVSNEVGLGVHPETPLGLRYRDVLGLVNQAWAARAATTLFLVAGRAIVLDEPWKHVSS
ncbi:MAG: bifunctional adenosylcobinamide kinase/adenosylcobinamide-phosphate guanylyltransferase [Ilumatobacteraceae bacterium]